MVALVDSELQNMRNALRHALQFPETSKEIIDLLLISAKENLGMQTVRDLITEFKLIP